MEDSCRIRLRVRYGEADRMGIAYYANYFDWFTEGRTEFLRQLGGEYRRIEDDGLLLPVLRTGARYLRPCRYDDVVELETTARVSPTRLRFDYRLEMGDLLREQLSTAGSMALLASHDLREVQRLGDRICLISSGQMLAEGPVETTLRQPPNLRSAELLGYRPLPGGLVVHPGQAVLRPGPGLVEVAGVVVRAVPQDFGWRLELRTRDGRPFSADLPAAPGLPAPGDELRVYFPDLRLGQSGDGV